MVSVDLDLNVQMTPKQKHLSVRVRFADLIALPKRIRPTGQVVMVVDMVGEEGHKNDQTSCSLLQKLSNILKRHMKDQKGKKK